MNLVLGAKGRLGSALCSALAPYGVIAPPRQIYSNWWRANSTSLIREFLGSLSPRIHVIHIAAGVIDPNATSETLYQVNLDLPLRILDAASSLSIRVVTYGTMLETLGDAGFDSSYVPSKIKLGREVEARARDGVDALHIRLHTLYGGGNPTPFMFLGQMLSALRASRSFEMSAGNQLREYHHVDDEGVAIRTLAAAGVKGSLLLSHGDAMPLVELARHCFERLGSGSLLRVGVVPTPLNDVFATRFARTPQLEDHAFRDARLAVPEYLKTYVQRETPQ